MGLALSGGGIRSATFSLGVLQSLARRERPPENPLLLRRIDYLSTVSGGGYTGCYFGSLFLPEALRQASPKPPMDVTDFEVSCNAAYEALKQPVPPLRPPASGMVRSAIVKGTSKEEEGPENNWSDAKAFEWLRNNGQFLAPRGAGDLIYVAAMQIRNWAAVQYVVGVVIVFLLLFFATTRAWMIATCPWWQGIEVLFLPDPGARIYWSPGWVLVGGFGLLFLVPPALAYWVAHARVDRKEELSWFPLWHEYAIIFFLLLGLTWAYGELKVLDSSHGLAPALQRLPYAFWAAASYVLVSVCGIVVFVAGLFIERRGLRLFTVYLAIADCLLGLIVIIQKPGVQPAAGVALLFVAVVSIAYLVLSPPKRLDLKSLRTRFTRWLRWMFQAFLGAAGLALLGTIGQTVYAYLSLEPGARTGAFAGLTSLVAALVAGARLLFKWLGSGTKREHPRIPFGPLAAAAAMLLLLLTGGAWATLVQSALWGGGPPPALPPAAVSRAWSHADNIAVSTWGRNPDWVPLHSPLPAPPVAGVAVAPGWMSVLLVGVFFLVVTTGLFLNFLNMSSLHQFYAARLTRAFLGATNRDRFKKKTVVTVTSPLPTDTIKLDAYYDERLAAPVHLINVTVNQTRASEEQLVQRDRKGTSMAIGPKYTIVNTAIFKRDDAKGTLWPVNEHARTLARQDSGPPRRFGTETLDLGDWCAISGAAFSTGLGMRTSLGLSLLAGLANVRLGYWWSFNSERFPSGFFAVYRYLWGELMADFKGPWKPFWFLTDGGHFDNTAVYELARRRVGTILLCDNSCDPEFRFEELGNLARKIRMDFAAELLPIVPAGRLAKYFATAQEFADPELRKGKCALLYEIRYPGAYRDSPPADRSLLIVLKPNMIPGAPLDVIEYASANEPFPHQTTLDQFFDDAQWESYRKLAEVIADAVLEPAALDLEGWRASLPHIPEAPVTSPGRGVEPGA